MKRNNISTSTSWYDHNDANDGYPGIDAIVQMHEHRGSHSGVDDAYNNRVDVCNNSVDVVLARFLSNSAITKNHWDRSIKSNCSNKKCKKKFSLLVRPSHCRRCGQIFCKECAGFLRRLNTLANPDTEGKLLKVCEACFDKGTQEFGVTRNLWAQFQGFKRNQKRFGSSHRTGWRKRFDLRRECSRLTDGFMAYLKKSGGEVRRAIADISALLSVPEWQRSQYWIQENLSTKCRYCERAFTVFAHRHLCRVCGIAACSNCSNKDLIVYMPDDVTGSGAQDDDLTSSGAQDGDVVAKLAVIKVIGCPTVEPSYCLYLRVCMSCCREISDMQATSHGTHDHSQPLLQELTPHHEHVMDIRIKIISHINDYQTIVDSLDDNSNTSLSETGNSRCNMKTLAKAQTDLSDFFTQFIMRVQKLKELKTLVSSPAQSKLLNHFIRSTCDFYMDNMCTFRQCMHSLETVCQPETLLMIQRIMDKDAIVSAHIYVRQIVYEVLHLTTRHSILLNLPDTLVPVEAEIEKEAEACILREGESWDDHQQLMQELVQSQLQGHRLIRPSRRSTKRHGSSHVQDVTLRRTLDVLMQVRLQLTMKTAHKNFTATKTSLLNAFTEVESLTK